MADEAQSDEDDELLVLRIAVDRDADALALLMKRHSPKLKGHLLSRFNKSLKEPEMDEAINQAFMTVWQKAGCFDSSIGSVKGWLIRITQNKAISIHRMEKRLTAASLEHDPTDELPEDCDDESDELDPSGAWRVAQLDDIIENHLKGLEQAVARALYISGGDPDIERLAKQYNTSKNTVTVTKCKVREKLRRMLQERETQRNRAKGRT